MAAERGGKRLHFVSGLSCAAGKEERRVYCHYWVQRKLKKRRRDAVRKTMKKIQTA